MTNEDQTSPRLIVGTTQDGMNRLSRLYGPLQGGYSDGKRRQRQDFAFRYVGGAATNSQCHCGVTIFPADHGALVILSQRPEIGNSVTNLSEGIATALLQHPSLQGYRHDQISWVEYYGPESGGSYKEAAEDTWRCNDPLYQPHFDSIRYSWDGSSYTDPKWSSMTHDELCRLVERYGHRLDRATAQKQIGDGSSSGVLLSDDAGDHSNE
jgi:hypothetical protein